MPSMWMPGAVALPSSHDAGTMLGTEKKVTWHTFEAPSAGLTALNGAQRLIAAGNEVHLCFNPFFGTVVQMLPANRAGRGLVNAPGGVETNRSGLYNIQIEVIAYAQDPWTAKITPNGDAALTKIMDWLRSLGIPDALPAGNPPAYPGGSNPRSTTAWAKSGHFNHSQVPENLHGDSGAINMQYIFNHETIYKPPTPVKESEMVLAYDFGGNYWACGVAGKRKIQKVTYDTLLARGIPTMGKQAGNLLGDFPTIT